MLKIPPRGRHITQEPQTIAVHLLGAQLATVRRRSLAFFLDVMLFGIVVGGVFIGLTYLSLDREDPTFFPSLGKVGELPEGDVRDQEKDRLMVDFLKMVDRRCPEAMPDEFHDLVGQDSPPGVKELPFQNLTMGFGSGKTELSKDEDHWTLSLGTDLLLGKASSVFSWGAFFVVNFTIMTRLGRGRTIGKKLMGLRVVRLDGKPLSWWDTFSRAGGYGASTATLFLGFLEAVWHPNRQAMHDRIVSTVVTRS